MMKLPKWLAKFNTQTRWMIALIVLLVVMIITRWGAISNVASEAFRDRFKPPMDTVSNEQTPALEFESMICDSIEVDVW